MKNVYETSAAVATARWVQEPHFLTSRVPFGAICNNVCPYYISANKYVFASSRLDSRQVLVLLQIQCIPTHDSKALPCIQVNQIESRTYPPSLSLIQCASLPKILITHNSAADDLIILQH